jgi:Zn finger protein HypA/HybF involved in hydrogenase expression
MSENSEYEMMCNDCGEGFQMTDLKEVEKDGITYDFCPFCESDNISNRDDEDG